MIVRLQSLHLLPPDRLPTPPPPPVRQVGPPGRDDAVDVAEDYGSLRGSVEPLDGARLPGKKGPDLASPVPEKLRAAVMAQWDQLRECVEKLRPVERYQVVSIAYRRYS